VLITSRVGSARPWYGVSFVARWELPSGRQGMRYDVDGDNGIVAQRQ